MWPSDAFHGGARPRQRWVLPLLTMRMRQQQQRQKQSPQTMMTARRFNPAPGTIFNTRSQPKAPNPKATYRPKTESQNALVGRCINRAFEPHLDLVTEVRAGRTIETQAIRKYKSESKYKQSPIMPRAVPGKACLLLSRRGPPTSGSVA